MSESQADKRRASMIAKFGSEEAWQDAQRGWGSKGGQKTASQGKTGFQTMTSAQKSEAGKKGHAAMIEKARSGN